MQYPKKKEKKIMHFIINAEGRRQKGVCDKMAKIEFSLSQAKTSLPLPLAWTYVPLPYYSRPQFSILYKYMIRFSDARQTMPEKRPGRRTYLTPAAPFTLPPIGGCLTL